MFHRIVMNAKFMHFMASQPVTWSSVMAAGRGVFRTARTTLTVFGLSAVAMLGLLYTNEGFAKRVSEMLHPQPVEIAAAPVAAVKPTPVLTEVTTVETTHLAESHALLGNSKQQERVTNWLSKRYRVAGDAANMLVSTAYITAHDLKLDPLLILAVMAIESGLNPFAESSMGAKGLMQVMAKVHHDKFEDLGGPQAALNPVANIRVGAQILKDYVKRTGSVEGGLKTYVGAADLATDSGYGSKVLAEYGRLKQVASGKNVPIFTRATPTPVVAKQTAPEATKTEAKPVTTAKSEGTDIKAASSESLAGL